MSGNLNLDHPCQGWKQCPFKECGGRETDMISLCWDGKGVFYLPATVMAAVCRKPPSPPWQQYDPGGHIAAFPPPLQQLIVLSNLLGFESGKHYILLLVCHGEYIECFSPGHTNNSHCNNDVLMLLPFLICDTMSTQEYA